MTLLFALNGIILFPANIHNAISKFLTFQLIFPFSKPIFVNFIVFTLSKHKHLHIFVAYGDGKNHNLHFENRKELRLATEKFKKQFFSIDNSY